MQGFMQAARRTNRTSILLDERGLSTVEYVIILVLVAAAAVTLWVNFGETLRVKLGEATEKIDNEVQIEGSHDFSSGN